MPLLFFEIHEVAAFIRRRFFVGCHGTFYGIALFIVFPYICIYTFPIIVECHGVLYNVAILIVFALGYAGVVRESYKISVFIVLIGGFIAVSVSDFYFDNISVFIICSSAINL